jgi:hypothetical protein
LFVSGANLGRWLLISSGDRGEVIGDRGPRGDVTHAVAGFAAAGSPESPAPPLLLVVVIVVVVVVPLLLLAMRSALLSVVSLLPLPLRLTVDGEASGDDGCDPPESLPLPRSFFRPNDRRCLGDDASSLSLPPPAASSPWLLPLSLVRDRAEPRRPLRPPRPSPPLPRCLRPVSSAAAEEASAECCCWSSSSSSGRVAKVPERRAHRLPFFSRGRCGVANRNKIIIN